jgi:uncharacterized protein (DUF2249 family)
MTHVCNCHGRTDTVVVATHTVGEVVARSPRALEVMQEFGINHCCGAGLTLAEAAAAAGVSTEALLSAVRRAVGEPGTVPGAPGEPATPADVPRPAALATLRPVHLDVRDDIRQGQKPFARIMRAVETLGQDEALVVRAPFEPIPLCEVLGKRGLAHWTERHAADDWSVWFYRAGAGAGGGPASPVAAPSRRPEGAALDVRGLEPPQPMVQVLERLDALGPDEELLVMHDRKPMLLYPQLDARGFLHETCEVASGVIEIRIRRAAGSDAPAGAAG